MTGQPPGGDGFDLTAREEAALLRALRDINDGHLTLWIDPTDYDPAHGPAAAVPRVFADREPPAGVPTKLKWWLPWWWPLVHRGWIAPHVVSGRPYYRATDEGRRVLSSPATQ